MSDPGSLDAMPLDPAVVNPESFQTDEEVLTSMAAAECERASELLCASSPSIDIRDAVLRSFCLQACDSGWTRLFPGVTHPEAAPFPAAVVLQELRQLPPSATDVLGVEAHHAFVASVAAYRGVKLSPGWLRDLFKPAVAGYKLIDCINGGGGVSSTLLQHGRSLYVATAGAVTWPGWVEFFAQSAVTLDAGSFTLDARPPQAAPSVGFAVHQDVWAAFCAQRLVLTAVQNAANGCLRDGIPFRSIVFCGHGLGGAVAQLMTATWESIRRDAEPPMLSLVTFGCPAVGDAAFQEWASKKMWHQRLFVEHDPIAGLPHSLCDGLRLSGGTGQYSEMQAQEHWELSLRGRAKESGSASPRVPSLSVAGIAFASQHPLTAYAECLVRHYELTTGNAMRAVASSTSQLTASTVRSIAMPSIGSGAALTKPHDEPTNAPSIFPCPVCHVVFRNKDLFTVHMQSHKDDARFVCPMPGCMKSFRGQGSLAHHLSAHALTQDAPQPSEGVEGVQVALTSFQAADKTPADRTSGVTGDASRCTTDAPDELQPSGAPHRK